MLSPWRLTPGVLKQMLDTHKKLYNYTKVVMLPSVVLDVFLFAVTNLVC
jgi:hypothetical protein